MSCTSCGATVAANVSFCATCGSQIKFTQNDLGQKNPSTPRPWLRFWARIIDLNLFASVLYVVFAVGGAPEQIDLLAQSKPIVQLVVLVCLWMPIEALLLATLGTTPGKWVLKIRLLQESGSAVPLMAAFSRSYHVWFRGLGAGIPIVNLFSMGASYRHLMNTGSTTWDKACGFQVLHKDLGIPRTVIASLLIVTIFSLPFITAYFELDHVSQTSNPLYPQSNGGDASMNLPGGTQDYVSRCDELAAHPSDHHKHAKGIPEDEISTELAIPYCTKAIEQRPDLARLYFQLGRALKVENHPEEALLAFRQAAERRHVAAYKYIGDAYYLGEGLPEGDSQDVQLARQWYEKGAEGGFSEARQALIELDEYIRVNTFSREGFQQPDFMEGFAKHDFEKMKAGRGVAIVYGRTVLETLNSDETYFTGQQSCKPIVVLWVKDLGTFGAKWSTRLDMVMSGYRRDGKFWLKLKDQAVAALSDWWDTPYYTDMAKKDTLTLITRHGCDNSIVKQVYQGIVDFMYESMDAPLETFSAPSPAMQ